MGKLILNILLLITFLIVTVILFPNNEMKVGLIFSGIFIGIAITNISNTRLKR